MKLTKEQENILHGGKGALLKKAMETLVRYGDMYDAECMVELNQPVHLVCSFATKALQPYRDVLNKFASEGIQTKLPFTADPKPMDFENSGFANEFEEEMYRKVYSQQEEYEKLLFQLGMKDQNSFTCACYFDEVGNVPQMNDYLAWAESSAVVYANSVLGARTNRNSACIDIFSGFLGFTPKFGLMCDDGRKANWIIILKTTKLPPAQILGSAIGMKVLEKVPYIQGLDTFLGTDLTNSVKDYLKDMGAAAASNGAVGLYHIENLTPEAKIYGQSLINSESHTYVIDDEEIERIKNSYPILWDSDTEIPYKAYIGCPHLSYQQLLYWSEKILKELENQRKNKVSVDTVLCSPRATIELFKKNKNYEKLIYANVHISYTCPVFRVGCLGSKPIITNSNKLRTYSKSRYFEDDELVEIIVRGCI